MKRFLIIIAIASFFLIGCTNQDEAIRVLTANGYTNIEITGWRPFAKSKNDFYSTGFKATAPAGMIVTGTVSSGIFKGATIRLD